MTRCRYAAKYKALKAPKCGCETCAAKWATAQSQRRIDAALVLVKDELIRATTLHGPMRSMHEAYGVIAEEFNKEFLDEMHANNIPNAKRELVQVAAMACRAIIDL